MAVSNSGVFCLDLGKKLAESFLLYAAYVIEDRAIPDIRDGLKPVHRRILYSMYKLGLEYNKPFKKSARTVGDVIGKYHPHGETSVYDAMTKLAQDFTMRYPLVEGHGNFGSIDGDPPAAQRYTEARLSKFGQLMLQDLECGVVDMRPNFDDSDVEPEILPTFFPNLLANGVSGIAVGVGTNIPPHHAASLYKAFDFIIDRTMAGQPVDINELIDIVQAPDFPTGGVITSVDGVKEAYLTGKGSVKLAAKYHIEKTKSRKNIVVTEIPYKVNKANLVEKIASLQQEMPEIKEVRDESNKDGIRIVIELSKDIDHNWVLGQLFKKTDLLVSIPMNFIAIADGKFVQFNLKDALEAFLAHVADIIIRRTNFYLQKDSERLQIIEGLIKCLADIDRAIAIIRSSPNSSAAIVGLRDAFGLSDMQANAVAEIKLRRLDKASIEDLRNELEALNNAIACYNDILNDTNMLLTVMRKELKAFAKNYQDERRTVIDVEYLKDFTEHADKRSAVKDEDLFILCSDTGLVKCVNSSLFAGRASRFSIAKSPATVRVISAANSRDDALFFTSAGRCFVTPVHKLPNLSKDAPGKPIGLYADLFPNERVVAVMASSLLSDEQKQKSAVIVTKCGQAKRIAADKLFGRGVYKVINLDDGDEVVSVINYSAGDIVLGTSGGKFIRFNPDDEAKSLRCAGRNAGGVAGLNVGDDFIVSLVSATEDDRLLIVTEHGFAKVLPVAKIPVAARGGKGVKACQVSDKTGAVTCFAKAADNMLVIFNDNTFSPIDVNAVNTKTRTCAAKKVVDVKDAVLAAVINL